MKKSKKSGREESMQYEVQLPYFLLQCKSQAVQSS